MPLSLPAWLHKAKVPPCLGTNCSTICSACHRISTATHATSAPPSASPLLSLSRPSFLYHCMILCVICELHQPYICGCLEPPQQKPNYLSSGELPVMKHKQQHSKPPVWHCWLLTHTVPCLSTHLWTDICLVITHVIATSAKHLSLKYELSYQRQLIQLTCIAFTYLFISFFIHLLIHSHSIYLEFTVPDMFQTQDTSFRNPHCSTTDVTAYYSIQ